MQVYPADSSSEVRGVKQSGLCQAPGTKTMLGFGFDIVVRGEEEQRVSEWFLDGAGIDMMVSDNSCCAQDENVLLAE